MKKTMMFLVCSLFYMASHAQVKVGADRSFKRSLNDYNTYGWSSNIEKIPSSKIFIGPNGVLVFNNESLREKIKNQLLIIIIITIHEPTNLRQRYNIMFLDRQLYILILVLNINQVPSCLNHQF